MSNRLEAETPHGVRVLSSRFYSVILALGSALACWPVQAIILFSTGDPSFNTNAPTGSLTNSGWQFQGTWGSYLGTPIAASYFITAKHVGGTVGDMFLYQGQSYETVAAYEDADSDLRIWRVCGRFGSFAALWTNRTEIGQALVVFGRGTQRGDELRVSGELKGWRWGTYDLVQRWGENRVSGITSGGSGIGELLQAAFNSDGGLNEAHLSVGDSGGAVFLQDGALWKLAGINYSVDGPYNTSTNGAGFEAAIFDEGGLYTGGEGSWVLQHNRPMNRPGAFYSTRISSRMLWINGILAQAPPPEPAPTVEAASSVTGPYVTDVSAVVGPAAKTIRLPNRGYEREFFRLRGCAAWRITTITRSGADLLFSYGE